VGGAQWLGSRRWNVQFWPILWDPASIVAYGTKIEDDHIGAHAGGSIEPSQAAVDLFDRKAVEFQPGRVQFSAAGLNVGAFRFAPIAVHAISKASSALRDKDEPRRQFLATAVLWPSQSMIISAIWRLFLSIIIMWPLPLMPSAGRYMNFATPPAPVMAATDSLHSLRRSS
jgi:hypothetical protein